MNAAEIASHLHGVRNGRHGWLVRCPCHEDKSPSLSIKDGSVRPIVVKCFAGCDSLSVLDRFRELGYLGPISEAKAYVPARFATEIVTDDEKLRAVKGIWRNSVNASFTPVETYLRIRGFTGPIPLTLRYHPALAYPGSKDRFAGMVAAVALSPSNEVTAIHRTFLTPTGITKANVEQPKMMLGNCRGGAVRLARSADTLIVGEGIETTLSAMQLYNLPGWAGMTASGIEGLVLPAEVRKVIICADQDEPTERYSRGHGVESANKAAARWIAQGKTVEIRTPPSGLKDFNDYLKSRQIQPSL